MVPINMVDNKGLYSTVIVISCVEKKHDETSDELKATARERLLDHVKISSFTLQVTSTINSGV